MNKMATWAEVTSKLGSGSSHSNKCITKSELTSNYNVDESKLTKYASNQLVDLDNIVKGGRVTWEVFPNKTSTGLYVDLGSSWVTNSDTWACTTDNYNNTSMFAIVLKDQVNQGLQKTGACFLAEINLSYSLTVSTMNGAGIASVQNINDISCATIVAMIPDGTTAVARYWLKNGAVPNVTGSSLLGIHNGTYINNIWVAIYRDGDEIRGVCIPKNESISPNAEKTIEYIKNSRNVTNSNFLLQDNDAINTNAPKTGWINLGAPYVDTTIDNRTYWDNIPTEWWDFSQEGMIVYGVYYSDNIFS